MDENLNTNLPPPTDHGNIAAVWYSFEGFWLATANDNFYASSGAIAVSAQPGASRHVGNELDLVAEYQMDAGLNFGFGYARLFAGILKDQDAWKRFRLSVRLRRI